MGLTAELQTDLKEAFDNDLSDAVKSFTLVHYDRDASLYDPAIGSVVRSSVSYNSRGIFDKYIQQERFNTTIQATDVKLIVIASEIDVEPKIADEVIQGGKTRPIKNVSKDPVNAIYELQLKGVES